MPTVINESLLEKLIHVVKTILKNDHHSSEFEKPFLLVFLIEEVLVLLFHVWLQRLRNFLKLTQINKPIN